MDNVEWYYDIPLSPPTSHDKYCLKLLTVREIDPTSPNSRIDVLQACQSFQGLLVPWLQRGSRNNQSGHRVDLSSDWHRAEKAPEESKFGMVKPSQTCIDFVFLSIKKQYLPIFPEEFPSAQRSRSFSQLLSSISGISRAMSLDPTFVPGVRGVLGRPTGPCRGCRGRGSLGHGHTPWAPWGAAMALPLLRGRGRVRRQASFGPTPISEEQKQDIQSTQIGSRVSYVVLSNMQLGFASVLFGLKTLF